MNRLKSASKAAALLLLLALPAMAAPKGGRFILTTGSFHGDEITKGMTQAKWLGVFVSDRSFSVQKIPVTFKRIQDEIVDREPGQITY